LRNLYFGGEHRNRLFMARGYGIFALYANAHGAPTGMSRWRKRRQPLTERSHKPALSTAVRAAGV
jgi:hypothetical protein